MWAGELGSRGYCTIEAIGSRRKLLVGLAQWVVIENGEPVSIDSEGLYVLIGRKEVVVLAGFTWNRCAETVVSSSAGTYIVPRRAVAPARLTCYRG